MSTPHPVRRTRAIKKLVDLPDPPWGKAKGESRQAFAAFALYRDLGPGRSTRRVAQELKKSDTIMGRWSGQWRWVDRSDLYDEMVDRRQMEARLDDRDVATRSERRLAVLGIRLVAQRIAGDAEAQIEALSANTIDSISEAAAALKIFIALRRLADGQPTDLIGGAMMVAPTEARGMIRLVVDTLLPYVEEDRRDAAILAVDALGT